MSKDNTPAFPFEYVNQTRIPQKSFVTDNMIDPDGAEQYSGMTLRDYFAAKAMAAIIIGNPRESGWHPNAERTVYLIADAMLAESAK